MEWKLSDRRIGGRPAIEHKITGELCLSCKYGDVWQHDETTYKAAIKSTTIAKKVGKYLKQYVVGGLPEGSEALFEFSEEDLPKVLDLMSMYRQRKSMLPHANNF